MHTLILLQPKLNLFLWYKKLRRKKKHEKKCKSVIPVMLVVSFVGDNEYDKEGPRIFVLLLYLLPCAC